MIEYRNVRVALLGAGSVGSQVARLLLEQGDDFAGRAGAGLELVGIGASTCRASCSRPTSSRSSSAPTSSSS
jgi:homoserine dehydrogenase